MTERLHKVMAAAGVSSRRAAERLIASGRVRVNGQVVSRPGSRVDPAHDVIHVDGQRLSIRPRRTIVLALNKPRGCVTTLSDPEGRPTVGDLVRDVAGRVFPVGRLDYNSEGLLLLTNDGALARDLMHPRGGVPKTYSTKVRGEPDDDDLRRLRRGVEIEGRSALATRIRVVRPGANSWLELTVVEGRKHIVRRMLKTVGHPVLKLRRVRYGPIALGNLAPGQWRRLAEGEIARLRAAPQAAPKPDRREPTESP